MEPEKVTKKIQEETNMKIDITNKKTGEVKNVTLPNCIATPVVYGGLAAGVTILGSFFVGLVEDGVHLVKKLCKKK